MSIKNYILNLGIGLKDVFGNTRVLGKGINVFFGDVQPKQLEVIINEAMDLTVAHYYEKTRSAGIFIAQQDIETLSLKVILHHLYIYNMWRKTYDEYRDMELKINLTDINHPQSYDQCYFFCKEKYGNTFDVYTAALTGMTMDEFKQWEKGRIAFGEMF